MGRRKHSADEMRLAGVKPNRWRKRLAEEQRETSAAAAPEAQRTIDPFKLENFKTVSRKAQDTFSSRIVPSCAVMLELGCVRFNWRSYAFLTIARAYAERNRHLPDCDAFLRELSNEHPAHFMDVAQTESIDKWFETFSPDPFGWELTTAEVFELVRIIGWRNPDSSPRHDSEFWKCNSHRNVLAAGFKHSNNLEIPS